MPKQDTKGITVRVDPALHAEITEYLREHEMTMGEFIAMAARDELHPKIPEAEVKEVENMRTLAFQVPESLFQRVKQYLERNQITQKAFVLGLIHDELDRDEELLRKQQEDAQADEEETQDEGLSEGSEAPVGEDSPEAEYDDEPEESPAVSDFEGGFEPEDEKETVEDYEEVEDVEFPEETDHDESAPFIEGELGAAVEAAPNFYYGQDEPLAFSDLEDEENQEFGGMSM